MKLKVRYFAVFREESGLGGESLDTTADTAGALYEELKERHRFRLDAALVRIAIDGSYVEMGAPLTEGAEVVLIPPVAGG